MTEPASDFLDPSLPTLADVRAAQERLRGRITHTPVLRVPALDALAGASLFLKAENLQRIGAFKARGALNAVLALEPAARQKGLITYSSGNHGQAVALAAKEVGTHATIVMPEDAPKVKVDAVRALGAEIVFAGTTSNERMKVALELRDRTGAVVIPPFDDADVIAGQGTATLELLLAAEAEGGPLDAVLVPVGGGGLLAGACLAAQSSPTTRIIAVEPDSANAMQQSLAKGERVQVQPSDSIADGLKPVQVGQRNFAIARAGVSEACTVSDEAMGRALVLLLLHGKVLVEPSGAATLALALEKRVVGQRIGVILSGGNVAPERISELLGRYA